MATIGTFKKTGSNEFTGEIVTLSVQVSRLVKALHGRAVPQDTRLTDQQLRRARHMLQAVDGRTNGASYREIAEALFGVRRVADQPWKTSALRDTVKDLVRDGLAMIQGGYRQLLRHRRRS